MTRETKIGLLVGLAFIIVIGILLSDHLTSTTEPPPAVLTRAGDVVRQGVTVPGAVNPPITPVIPPQQPVVPQNPVPTAQDLAPKGPPVGIVQIGPGATPPAAEATNQQAAQPQPPLEATPVVTAPADPQPPVITQTPPQQQFAGPNPLEDVARQFNEELVIPGSDTTTTTTPPVQNTQASTTTREYKAAEGDTLSKMASKFYGSNTEANRNRIIAANTSLQKNPDVVVIGRTYTIPGVAGDATAARSTEPAPTTPVQVATAQPEYWYTVKEGDSLRKIAANQLGDENAWAAIQELNKTVLKGEDKTTVVPKMKLRLPAKPIASAS